MKVKLAACMFALLEALMLALQITTLVSTYWTSWDLRFSWTRGRDFTRRPQTDGQLISEGHAGLWSRCFRIYDTSLNDDSRPAEFNCLHNYDTTNGSLSFTFGKACKTATAALCIGDTALIITIFIIVLVSAFKRRNSLLLLRVSLPLLLLQGLICFAVPLTYLSGNMAELIDQLSFTYGLLLVIRMSPWYTHDWAFWTQVGLVGVWILSVAAFVLFYSFKTVQRLSKHGNCVNGKRDGADGAELEALKG